MIESGVQEQFKPLVQPPKLGVQGYGDANGSSHASSCTSTEKSAHVHEFPVQNRLTVRLQTGAVRVQTPHQNVPFHVIVPDTQPLTCSVGVVAPLSPGQPQSQNVCELDEEDPELDECELDEDDCELDPEECELDDEDE